MSEALSFKNHDRHFYDCRYVYPVVSRRSEGVSLGINLNLNRSCNWRCIYCQVDGLIRGKPETIDLELLESELLGMIEWIINGDFMEKNVLPEFRNFKDICLAGNGEPTLSPQFIEVCELVSRIRRHYSLHDVKTVLITNGSQLHKPMVQEGIAILNTCNGEVWFKIDRVTPLGGEQVNQVNLSVDSIYERLEIATRLCRTYIQSCWFKIAGQNPESSEVSAFVEFLQNRKLNIEGILLYSVARKPALPEGVNISSVDYSFLEQLANEFGKAGYPVKFYL